MRTLPKYVYPDLNKIGKRFGSECHYAERRLRSATLFCSWHYNVLALVVQNVGNSLNQLAVEVEIGMPIALHGDVKSAYGKWTLLDAAKGD